MDHDKYIEYRTAADDSRVYEVLLIPKSAPLDWIASLFQICRRFSVRVDVDKFGWETRDGKLYLVTPSVSVEYTNIKGHRTREHVPIGHCLFRAEGEFVLPRDYGHTISNYPVLLQQGARPEVQ